MALAEQGYELVVSLVDSAGDPTTRTYPLNAADATEAATATAAILAAIAGASDGVVAGYRLALVFYEDALSLPATGVEGAVEASLTAYIEDAGNKKGDYSIPMPKAGVFVGTIGKARNIVNTSAAIVLAYHALFSGATPPATFSDGEQAGGLIKGARVVGGKRQPVT